jgi:hypothetical protein
MLVEVVVQRAPVAVQEVVVLVDWDKVPQALLLMVILELSQLEVVVVEFGIQHFLRQQPFLVAQAVLVLLYSDGHKINKQLWQNKKSNRVV